MEDYTKLIRFPVCWKHKSEITLNSLRSKKVHKVNSFRKDLGKPFTEIAQDFCISAIVRINLTKILGQSMTHNCLIV